MSVNIRNIETVLNDISQTSNLSRGEHLNLHSNNHAQQTVNLHIEVLVLIRTRKMTDYNSLWLDTSPNSFLNTGTVAHIKLKCEMGCFSMLEVSRKAIQGWFQSRWLTRVPCRQFARLFPRRLKRYDDLYKMFSWTTLLLPSVQLCEHTSHTYTLTVNVKGVQLFLCILSECSKIMLLGIYQQKYQTSTTSTMMIECI